MATRPRRPWCCRCRHYRSRLARTTRRSGAGGWLSSWSSSTPVGRRAMAPRRARGPRPRGSGERGARLVVVVVGAPSCPVFAAHDREAALLGCSFDVVVRSRRGRVVEEGVRGRIEDEASASACVAFWRKAATTRGRRPFSSLSLRARRDRIRHALQHQSQSLATSTSTHPKFPPGPTLAGQSGASKTSRAASRPLPTRARALRARALSLPCSRRCVLSSTRR